MASKETTVRLHVDGMAEVQARIRALTSVLADRERELLQLKGPCSNKQCSLHYAHSGPCDVRKLVCLDHPGPLDDARNHVCRLRPAAGDV